MGKDNNKYSEIDAEVKPLLNNSMDIIKEKQRVWAIRNGKKLRNDYDLYITNVEDNIFNGLSQNTRKEFDDARGGELKDIEKHPAKMSALLSSSALCVNIFQYFQDKSKELKLLLLRECKLVRNDYNCDDVIIKFECTDYPICSGKEIIATPNIDIVIITIKNNEEDKIFAIESKFTEPYKRSHHYFLNEKYYKDGQNAPYWKSMGDLYEKLGIEYAEKKEYKNKNDILHGKEIDELKRYKYLNALQLIKHLMGVRCKWRNKSQIKLVYFFYDSLGQEGNIHRTEISKFNTFIEKATGVGFNYISYQKLICNLTKALPYNEHKEYIDYITERYL